MIKHRRRRGYQIAASKQHLCCVRAEVALLLAQNKIFGLVVNHAGEARFPAHEAVHFAF